MDDSHPSSLNLADHNLIFIHKILPDFLFSLSLEFFLFKKKGHFILQSFLSTGEFSPNFDLKNNMISTYTKDFSWK